MTGRALTVRDVAERISTGEAARICGVTRKTLLRLARSGKVPGAAELDDGLWRFDEARLRDWIRRREAACQRGVAETSIRGAKFGGRESKFPAVTSVEAYRRLLGLKP
jgi:predicted DNA-binding transcriptional regulator AlpA